MEKGKMPAGFVFAPTDEEIVTYYLRGKKEGKPPAMEGLIVGYDIYRCDPWDLPRGEFSYPGPQKDMYFFTPTHPPAKSNPSSSGKRVGRTAGCGVWHGNGKDHRIMGRPDSQGRVGVIGHKTSFKFEIILEAEASSSSSSSTRKGSRIKTDWLMHEYRLEPKFDVVLCRIYEKEKATVNGGWEHQCGGDGDRGNPMRPQHQPFSPPDMACWDQGTKESGLSIEDDDHGPTPKRRRVDVQPDDGDDGAFALELEGMLDTDEAVLEAPPSCTVGLPSSTPEYCPSSAPVLSPDTPFLFCSDAAGTQADPIVLDDSADEPGSCCPRVDPAMHSDDAFPPTADIVALPGLLPPPPPPPALPCDQQDWDWDPMLLIDSDTFLPHFDLEPASLPVAPSCEPQGCPDTPLPSCPEAPQDSIGGPDPAKGMRSEQPDHQHPQCSMAADQPVGNTPWSLSDVFTLEDIDALPLLPPPSHDPLDVESWVASVLALGEPPATDAPPSLPGLLPSPPLDAEAQPPPSSAPLMTDDVPIPHWPAFAHDCQPFEQIDTSPLLHQDLPSMVPSGLLYQF